MAASVGSALVPDSIGVVGVGTISSAAVRGLCRSSNAQFVLSPRNAAKAQALEQEFESVRIATDNQAVVDACDAGWAKIKASGVCPSYERGTSLY